MPQQLWTSILLPAIVATGVAALVTLAIEYFAKPSLDARAERILERHRSRRAAVRDLRHVAWICGRIAAIHDLQAEPLSRGRTVRFAAEVEPLARSASEQLDEPAMLTDDWLDTIVAVEATTLCLQTDVPVTARVWQSFRASREKLDHYVELFETPRWRWWRRHKLIRRIKSTPSPESTRRSALTAGAGDAARQADPTTLNSDDA